MPDSGYRIDYWADMATTIAQAYGDPEIGHGEEDKLLAEFIHAVADGTVPDPQAAAKILRDNLLNADRVRWYS